MKALFILALAAAFIFHWFEGAPPEEVEQQQPVASPEGASREEAALSWQTALERDRNRISEWEEQQREDALRAEAEYGKTASERERFLFRKDELIQRLQALRDRLVEHLNDG